MRFPHDFSAPVVRSKRAYIAIIRSVQLCLFILAGIAAFLLRFEFSIPRAMAPAMWFSVAIWLVSKAAVFQVAGLGRGMWRYFASPDVVRVVAANLAASVAAAPIILIFGPAPFPRSVLAIDLLVSLVFTVGIRGGTRMALEAASHANATGQERAFIYGAGSAGALLLEEARTNRSFRRLVCGFIDDDPEKLGMSINGLAVLGTGASLPQLAAAHRVREVLITIPSANGAQMSGIIQLCQRAGVAFHTIPSLSEIVAGRRISTQIRDVAVEDVLGRSAIELDWSGIRAKLGGKVTLVTGAAGSIGSELCRQIARLEPAALVAFDMSETALFEIEQEMRRLHPNLAFHPEIGSIRNSRRLQEVFSCHQPSIVYHAAAYKHVPMMEAHVFEAVENNVFGTYNVAAAAAEFGVEDFVMISSDKAVRPTNMMGATKRVSELAIRSLQNGGPRYVSVRFGNVLGSNGSVVPIFKRQIAAGGPVTVTHPEMRRYFMTIPEAVQLVLQASTMGKGGEIFVLDMGQPVRIADLARQLIVLSGLRPDHDIRIEFTGVRPGEKLYEELRCDGEETLSTGHGKISVFAGLSLPFEEMTRRLTVLRNACERRDVRKLVFELKDMIPDYNPSKELLQLLIEPGHFRLARAVADAGQAMLPARELSSVAGD
jgi:FlaA1/EpsC-like NDP-sugar epimerase